MQTSGGIPARQHAIGRPGPPAIVTAGIAIAAAVVVLVGTRGGSLAGLDSAVYLAGGRNLAAGHGYVGMDLRPITLFPPGFSATLAAPDALGIGAAQAARWLNAVALGGSVVLAFMLTRRSARYRWTPVAAGLAVAVMPAGFDVGSALWSEPVFCVATLGVLLLLETAIATGPSRNTALVGAAALASIACTYRYAGLAVIATGIIVIAWTGPDAVGRRIRRALVFGLIAAIAPVLIVARNISYGTLFGPRTASIESVAGLSREALTVLRGWVTGVTHDAVPAANVAVIVALAAVGVGALMRIRTHRRGVTSLAPVGVFVVVYIVDLVGTELATTVDPLGDRLLAPVVAPVVVLVACAIEALLDAPERIPRSLRIAGVALVAGAWMCGCAAVTIHRAAVGAPAANGYAARWWTGSSLVAATRRLPAGAGIATNNPAGIYLATGRQPLLQTPVSLIYRSSSRPPDIAAFRARLAALPAPRYLVWERLTGDTWDLTPAQLAAAGLRLVPVTVGDYGTVYRITGG